MTKPPRASWPLRALEPLGVLQGKAGPHRALDSPWHPEPPPTYVRTRLSEGPKGEGSI
jgi:hypothetical protein